MTDDASLHRLTPLQIAGGYLLFGLAALVGFDLVLPRVLARDAFLQEAQFAKGAVEVGLTAAFVFLLTWYAHRSLARANRRLGRKDEALQVLVRLLRHNVRNDVTVIRGHAETARDQVDDETVENSCDVILETTDGLLHQTETVNQLRDVLVGSTEQVRFDLAAVVDEVVSDVRDRQGLQATLDDSDVEDVAVRADRLLPVAIREIVENSIEHAEDGSPRVEFAVERRDATARLRIADDGPGIPEEELTVLTEREESPLAHASGIGLWFVHWIVNGSGGEVSLRTGRDGGTVIDLTLPTADG